MVEPGSDSHLSREGPGELSSLGAGRGLDRGVKEEEAVSRGRGTAAQVLKERPFRPQHLNGAGRESSQAVQAPRLSDHPGGELRPEKSRQVRGP